MRKANLLCALVIILLSCEYLTAQTLLNPISTLRLDLINNYPSLDGSGVHGGPSGPTTITSTWKLQFVNNNQVAFVTNGNQIIRMRSNAFYSQVPFVASSGMRSNTNIIADKKIGIGTLNPSEALEISSGVAKAKGFLVDGTSSLNSDWG